MNSSISSLLSAGRLQEAEWLMRRGHDSPLSIYDLASRLGTRLNPDHFFVSPGYYAPLNSWSEVEQLCGQAYESSSVINRYKLRAHNDREDHLIPRVIDPYSIRQLAALHHVWFSCGQPESLRVLDFGGALGSHFYSLSKYWTWSFKLDCL